MSNLTDYTNSVDMWDKAYDTYKPPYLIPGSFRTNKFDSLNDLKASYAHIVGKSVSWILPVPNLLNYESDYSWSEEDLGYQGKFLSDAWDWVRGRGDGDFMKNIYNVGKDLGRSGVSKLTSETATKQLMKTEGVAYNPNKQLYFNEVNMREFQIYFYLSPMSKEEAVNIKSSFRDLVYAAAPGYRSDKFFFSYPDFFNFRVVLNGTTMLERRNLAITQVHLDFTSDGNMTWHEDGFPTSLQLTVGFKESEIPTKENLAKITVFGVNLGSGWSAV